MSELQNFLFEGLPVRGALVKLNDAWQEILARHRQAQAGEKEPVRTFFLPAVSELLGEMTAAAVLLQSTIKFDGLMELQIQGNGPLKMAVAEVRSDFGLRATAKAQADIPAVAGLDVLCNHEGKGRCAITLFPTRQEEGRSAYQGVVPLSDKDGNSFVHLNQVIEAYLMQSEQLPSYMILAADEKQAAGLLVQRLPAYGGNNQVPLERGQVDEHFNRIAILAKSLKREELLTLSSADILKRLFWQEDLRLFDKRYPYFRCSCSRQRVANMLEGLGAVEVQSILEEQNQIEVACDFCGQVYHFDAVDAQQLFVSSSDSPPASGNMQ